MSKGVTVGLDKVYYAILTKDDVSGVEYETPKPIPGAIQATLTPNINSATLFGDDQALETDSNLGDIAFTLNVKSLPNAVLADLLGHRVDAAGVLHRSKNDVAPYVAIGYRRRKSNGAFRYIWNYKGKFQPEAQDAQTKTDTPAFQTPTINATFLPRASDGEWQVAVNSDDDSIDQSVTDNWFNAVYEEVQEA